jgi:hypothetical protein
MEFYTSLINMAASMVAFSVAVIGGLAFRRYENSLEPLKKREEFLVDTILDGRIDELMQSLNGKRKKLESSNHDKPEKRKQLRSAITRAARSESTS